MAIYHPKWMKCSLCTTAEHGRNSRLRGGAMQSNSPLRSTTSVVSHLLTYLHNGRSQTMFAKFYPLLITYLPPVDICREITLHSHWKNLHIVDISSTTHLPGIVNVVCEWPLICNYNWLSALRPLQIQKHPLWSESCSSIKYKKNHRDLGKYVAFVTYLIFVERSPLSAVQWYDLFSHTRWTILTFDNHCTSSHSGLFGQDRTCSESVLLRFDEFFSFRCSLVVYDIRRVRLSLCDLSSRTSVVTERLPVVHLKRKTIIHYNNIHYKYTQ